jgi:hypothetical protein
MSGATSLVVYVNYINFHTAVKYLEVTQRRGRLKLIGSSNCFIFIFKDMLDSDV